MKIFWLFPFILFANEQILVPLSVRQSESTCYIAPMSREKCDFSEGYLLELDAILKSDFSLFGRSHLAPDNAEIDKLLSKKNVKEALDPKSWQHLGIDYVIRSNVVGDTIEACLYQPKSFLLTPFSSVHLSGKIATDRRKIHKLSDAIHLKMYGVPGIASKRILYASHLEQSLDREKWTSEIQMIDPDGEGIREVTREKSYSISPLFLPGGLGIAYVCYKNGPPKILSCYWNEESGRRMIDLRGNQLLPTIAKSGDRIAFISDASGSTDLFYQNYDRNRGAIGKPIQLYSFPFSVQSSPSFSPDGRKLAFVSDKEKTPNIYIMDLDKALIGGKLPDIHCITRKNRDNTAPCWSPDGKKIAYSAKTDNTRQIWIYDVETSVEEQLTTGTGHKENPSWAPDSFHIVYNTTSPTYDLFVIDLLRAKPMQITKGPEIKHYPNWEGA